MSREWSNGLFGCFNDVTTCMVHEDVAAINIVDVISVSLTGIISTFVPCYTLGKNAEAVSENCLLCGLSYFIWPLGIFAHVTIRGKIRDQKGIEVRTQCLYLCILFTVNFL